MSWSSSMNKMPCFLVTFLGHMLAAASVAADDMPPTVQLYLYLSPAPKWGYIEEAAEKEGLVPFYECGALEPISLQRERLKRAEGGCKDGSKRRGTWIATYKGEGDEAGFVVLQSGKEKAVFASEEWRSLLKASGKAEESVSIGDVVGITTKGTSRRVFAVEE